MPQLVRVVSLSYSVQTLKLQTLNFGGTQLVMPVWYTMPAENAEWECRAMLASDAGECIGVLRPP